MSGSHDHTIQHPDVSAKTRAGFVAIIGLPNAGKSSLLNRLLDQKLSIVTSAAQTTRERVVGIYTEGDVQIVFVDTPGLVDPSYLLHEAMRSSAIEALTEVDVVLLVVDAALPVPELGEEVLELLRARSDKLIIALNKGDRATREQLAAAEHWADTVSPARVIVISALTGSGVEPLKSALRQLVPHSPFLYPEDEISSQSVRFFVSELVRETVIEQFRDEVPYSLAAIVEEYREAESPVYIRVGLYVERASQKGILIGKKGSAIRSLGEAARRKIEQFVGAPVYLDLWVKVLPRWRKDPTALRHLGFQLPPQE